MMDAATAPTPTISLLPLGDAAPGCEGDFCAIPENHTQALVNRKLDSDDV